MIMLESIKNIDRDAISSKHFASKNDFGTFVPRFARNENNLIKDCYESYKNLIEIRKENYMSRQFYFLDSGSYSCRNAVSI